MTVEKGLKGVIAGETSICKIDSEKGRLWYRGYSIEDLARKSTFEEVIFLLWYDKLPTKSELDIFKQKLSKNMKLPSYLKRFIKTLPQKGSSMASLRTCISLLGANDSSAENISQKSNTIKSIKIMAIMPCLIAAIYRHRHNKPILKVKKELSFAANFLYMVNGEIPSDHQIKIFDTCLILHAEHNFNASTFAARITVSTLSDIYSGIVTALSTLKGPLHGGANKKAIQALHKLEDKMQITDICDISSRTRLKSHVIKLLNKHQKVMGIGHPVYKVKDPRAVILEDFASHINGKNLVYYQMAKEIEQILIEKKNIYPNIDFFSGIVYESIGISSQLFVSIFAMARTSGWLAHIMEQYSTNKLIRPLGQYIGKENLEYIPIGAR